MIRHSYGRMKPSGVAKCGEATVLADAAVLSHGHAGSGVVLSTMCPWAGISYA